MHQIVGAQRQRRPEGHGGALLFPALLLFFFLCALGLLRGLRRRVADRFFLPRIRRGIVRNAAVQKPHDARGIPVRQLRVVRDHDDQPIARDLLQDLHDLHARFRIQRAGRLVRQQNLRIVDQRARDRHALHLAAGHLVRLFGQLIAEADAFERLFRAFAAFGFRYAGQRERQLHVGQRVLVRDQVVVLKHEPHGMVAVAVPIGVPELLGRPAGNGEVAGIIPVQSADDVQQRRLAAAGRAEDRNKFVPAKSNTDPAQRLHARVARLIGFYDVG